jgi:subtilisin-like proprotein convertase family protein
MRMLFRGVVFSIVFAIAIVLCTPFTIAQSTTTSQSSVVTDLSQLSVSAQRQIQELMADKQARTPTQRKIGSSLLYAAKQRRGEKLTAHVSMLKPIFKERSDGRFDVEIRGRVSKSLISAIEKEGGEVVAGNLGGAQVRAILTIDAIENLAQRPDVRGIHETLPSMTQQYITRGKGTESVRIPLKSALKKLEGRENGPVSFNEPSAGSVTSQGVAAHRVDEAQHFYGLTGAGVKIGVLSSSDDFKENSIATGDLPADTVTVPGQDGRPGSGEGTAMMEIVHDIAPGAKLFFATANNSPESFADNIRTLRFTYGCDIIVDDVIYYFESPYQDDIIAQAVRDVMGDGALYFSSAGNQGNLDDGTSGTWEGTFKSAGALSSLPSGYTVHAFKRGNVSDRIEVGGGPLILHWSNPGSLDNPQASDDYDIFVLDDTLTNVVVASTDIQDGDDLPFEFLGFNIPAGFRVVIAKKAGSADQVVRIELFGGELAIATSGGTYGHSAVDGAFSIAAVDAATAGGGAFTGGNANPVELFSTDGNRRIFFNPDGSPIGAGRGEVRKKPDFAAADGVATTLPSFTFLNPFFGTSAAAPHAAAIAGLLKSAKPSLNSTKIRTAFKKSALDIEGPGIDRDSGRGIIDAFGALAEIKAQPAPFLELGTITTTPTTGDADAFIEPGESADFTAELVNTGGAAPTNLNGVLTTSTPGITLTNDTSSFPAISPSGGTGVNNVPFSFSVANTATCGVAANFTLTASYSNGGLSPQTFNVRVPTGKPSSTPIATSFTGPAVVIPDGNATGVSVPLNVSGVGAVSKLVFSFDGTSCSTTIGSTTVGLDHSWVGDLIVTLTSPSGTTVTLMNRPGGTGNSGNNFCQTVLDDAAVNSIQNIPIAGNPYTGTFKPASPLSAFAGEDANGTWQLHLSDNATFDTGSVRAFTLAITSFVCD